MTTNLILDEELVFEAQKAGKHKTGKEAVEEAIGEYIQRRKQDRILELFGKIDYDNDYSYKNNRNRP